MLAEQTAVRTWLDKSRTSPAFAKSRDVGAPTFTATEKAPWPVFELFGATQKQILLSWLDRFRQ